MASEANALAEQTAKATNEIGQQIGGIQPATQDSVTGIKEISGTIEKLSGITVAVEEQGAGPQEISGHVQQAAQGTQQVSFPISDVRGGATETGSASSQVLSAAQLLLTDQVACGRKRRNFWKTFAPRELEPRSRLGRHLKVINMQSDPRNHIIAFAAHKRSGVSTYS